MNTWNWPILKRPTLRDGTYPLWEHIKPWCNRTCEGRTEMDWSVSTGIVREIKFELESDMLLFQLKWL